MMNVTYILYVDYGNSVSKVSRTNGVIFLLLCARYLREKFYLLKMTHSATLTLVINTPFVPFEMVRRESL